MTDKHFSTQGHAAHSLVWHARNIRYAAPPVAEHRWRPPQPLDPARAPPVSGGLPIAIGQPQSRVTPHKRGQRPSYSQSAREDCLLLDVYTPVAPSASQASSARLPVVVVLSDADFLSDPPDYWHWPVHALVATGRAVLVQVSVRTGVFGYLDCSALRAEDALHAGSYGTLDQLAALRWVRRHIGAFGGNPRCVTLCAHGSAADSVVRLLTWAGAQDLYHRAALFGLTATYPFLNCGRPCGWSEGKTGVGDRLLATLCQTDGQQGLATLRAMPAWRLMHHMDTHLWWALHCHAGWGCPQAVDAPLHALTLTRPHIPLWMSYVANAGEALWAGLMAPHPLVAPGSTDQHGAPARIRETYPEHYKNLCEIYPGLGHSGLTGLGQFVTDSYAVAPLWWIAQECRGGGGMWLTHTLTDTGCQGDDMRVLTGVSSPPTGVASMQDYFLDFVATGNPNGYGTSRPHWPALHSGHAALKLMQFGTDVPAQCALLPRQSALATLVAPWPQLWHGRR